MSSHDTSETALETLTLGLPWLDVADPDVVEVVDILFDRHKRLGRVEINKQAWGKKSGAVHPECLLPQ